MKVKFTQEIVRPGKRVQISQTIDSPAIPRVGDTFLSGCIECEVQHILWRPDVPCVEVFDIFYDEEDPDDPPFTEEHFKGEYPGYEVRFYDRESQ